MNETRKLSAYQVEIARLEPLVSLALGFHGFLMLALRETRAWQWAVVGFVGVLGLFGLIFRNISLLPRLRAICILLSAWLLMLTTGGTASFFLLWYFVLVAIYPLVLHREYGIIFPVAAALLYTSLLPFSSESVPVVVVLARASLLIFIGWIVWMLNALTRRYMNQLELSVAELEPLYSAAQDLSSSLEPAVVLEKLARHFTSALSATSGYILQAEPDRKIVTVLAEYWSGDIVPQESKSDLGRSYRLDDYPATANALNRKETMVLQVDDPNLSAAERDQLLEYGIKSALLVPLVTGGKLVGEVEVWDSSRPRSFTPVELRRAQLLASHAAGILENSQLYQQTRQREIHLATVLDVARTVSSSIELEEVLKQVTHCMEQSLHMEHCAISDYDPLSRTVRTLAVHVTHGLPAEGEEVGLRYALADYPSTARVVESDQFSIIRVDDPKVDSSEAALLRQYGRSVMLMLPLRIGDRPVGLIELYTSDAQRNFSLEEIQLAQTLADQVAVALENARLFTETKKLSSAIEQAADNVFICDRDGIIEYVNKAFEELTGYTRAESIGKTPRILKSGLQPSEFYENLWSKVLNGEVFHAQIANRKKNGDLYYELKTITPLRDAQGSITHFISSGKDITDLKKAEDALHHQMSELAVLHKAAIAGAEIPDEDQLIERVTHIIGESLYPDDFGVMLVDDALSALRFHPSYRRKIHEQGREKVIPLGKGITGRVAVTRKSLRIPDTEQEEDYIDIGLLTRMRSELCVPIQIGEKVIGVVNVENFEKDAFTENDERLLLTVAGQLATAIERSRIETAKQKRMKELETLARISASLRVATTLDEMLPLLLDKILEALGADSGCIALFDPIEARIRPVVERGWLTSLHESSQGVFENIANRVFASGEIYLSREFVTDPQVGGSRRQVPEGWGGACIPIQTALEAVGVLFVAVPLPRELVVDETSLLTTVAEIAGNAIHRTRLHDQTLRQAEDLFLAYDRTLEGWSHALELRDRETAGHTRRVTGLTMKLAQAIGMSEAELKFVRWGALLHDIGKMGIPDSILLKSSKLTAKEQAVMMQHPALAYDLLSPIAYLQPALDIPYCHHEKWDGSGYPRGLAGEEIPLAARIFTVADVWDALLSHRPYRKAWPKKRVVSHIRQQSGKYFDPKVVNAFLKMLEV